MRPACTSLAIIVRVAGAMLLSTVAIGAALPAARAAAAVVAATAAAVNVVANAEVGCVSALLNSCCWGCLLV